MYRLPIMIFIRIEVFVDCSAIQLELGIISNPNYASK